MNENSSKPYAADIKPISLHIVRLHTGDAVDWQPDDYITDENEYVLPEFAGILPPGCVFKGWRYGDNIYQPGATVHFHNDIIFDAEYDYQGQNREKLEKFEQGGSVAAFSLRDPRVRSIMSSIDSRDLMSSYNDGKPLIIACTGLVVVERAWWEQQYDQKARRYNDVMKVTGSIREVFLESPDPNFKFPCGTRRMTLHEAYPMEWTYVPSPNEYALLHQKGMCFGDLQAPATMVQGAMVEFPIEITYDAIYNTPITVISILNNFSMKTTSFESGYDTMFEAVPQSKLYTKSLQSGLQPSMQMTDNQVAMAYLQQMNQDEIAEQYDHMDKAPEEVHEVETKEMTKEEVDRFEKESSEATLAKLRRASENMKGIGLGMDSNNAIYTAVVEDLEKDRQTRIEQKARGRAMSEDAVARETDEVDPQYGDFIEMLDKMLDEGEDRKVKGSESDSDVQARKDMQMLNELLKNPQANIAEITGVTPIQERTEKNRQSQDAARQYDVAEDNKALNAGNTNIAGHGASMPTAKKGAAASLLSNVKANAPTVTPDAPAQPNGNDAEAGKRFM